MLKNLEEHVLSTNTQNIYLSLNDVPRMLSAIKVSQFCLILLFNLKPTSLVSPQH